MNVEIEITLRCNRSCHPCNRHSNLFKFIDLSSTDMSLEQIERFCCHVEHRGEQLGHISLLGGEPLLHPKLRQITDILYNRLKKRKLVKQLNLTTNGDALRNAHPRCLEHLNITVSWTKRGMIYVLTAPKDTQQVRRRCPVPKHCGVCLNTWGYWLCGPGAAIARLFGLKQFQSMELPKGIKSFGKLDQEGNLADLCELCQWSARKPMVAADNFHPSSSYVAAIERYKSDPVCPTLERF